MKRFSLLIPIILLLCSCEGRQFFYTNEDKPDYARTDAADGANRSSRAPLDVPPELRAELELPGAESVAATPMRKCCQRNIGKLWQARPWLWMPVCIS